MYVDGVTNQKGDVFEDLIDSIIDKPVRSATKTSKLDWARATLSKIDEIDEVKAKTVVVGEEELKIEDDPSMFYQTKKVNIPVSKQVKPLPEPKPDLGDAYERLRKLATADLSATNDSN